MRKMSYTTYPAPCISDIIRQTGIHNTSLDLKFDLGEEE
tara:strand:+ start:17175 stop:17291 length:117 start_codon:yes stop_codon:yes gene_type:complete